VSLPAVTLPTFDEIAENLSFLDDWEDRYRYVIDLGKALPALPEDLRTEANRVQGCASQVWLATDVVAGEEPVLTFRGDSDALIVRGLVALAIAITSGKGAREIAALDVIGKFDELGLKAHLSSQRSNGLRSMVARMRRDAEAALAG
jgi:cysteine desulfuration protein SufE